MIIQLPASRRVAVPWKNGGGVTREVCVFPVGAGMEDFLWRISIAEVTEAGLFSCFEGVDRHLTVLEGQLQLDLPDRRQTLGPLDSLAFGGDLLIHGRPLSGPVTDFNVMVRRGKVSAMVRQNAGHCEIYAQTAVTIDLITFDAVLLTGAVGSTFRPNPSILVEFYATDGLDAHRQY